jgi:hypothetical protein
MKISKKTAERIDDLKEKARQLLNDFKTKSGTRKFTERALSDFDEGLKRIPKPAAPVNAHRLDLAADVQTAADAERAAEQDLVNARKDLAELVEAEKQFKQMGL